MVKRAQGMSLNVIIIAALALIVLVVLTAIFIGRLGSFDDTVPKEAGARYQALSIMFGKCHPGLADEQQFYNLWGHAPTLNIVQGERGKGSMIDIPHSPTPFKALVLESVVA